MKRLEQFKDVVSQMGLRHGLRFIFNCINVRLHGYAMTDDVFHWKSSLFLKKILKKSKYAGEDLRAAKNGVPPNNCWILWFQGMENAPEIVKACFDSVKKNLTGYNVVVLTEKNLFEYVSLPDFIMRKYEAKKIQSAQFSDIVESFAEMWRHIPYYCDSELHFLQRNLGAKFEQEIFDHIKEISFCHKLTYKLSDSIKNDGNNFYNYIININNGGGYRRLAVKMSFPRPVKRRRAA